MFPRKKDTYKQRFYREELLGEITGKEVRTIRAWFRRNNKTTLNHIDILEYIKKFTP